MIFSGRVFCTSFLLPSRMHFVQEKTMQAFCCHCEKPIRILPGHLSRSYCSTACKQMAYRRNRLEKRRDGIRKHWQGYSPLAQQHLETLMRIYGEDAAQLATDALTH